MKKYVISGLIGFGISILCLIPPVIHFVTGPLGPFFGGLLGGMRTRAKWGGAMVIGLTIGTCLASFLILLGSMIMSFRLSLPGMMENIVSAGSLTTASLLKIALIPFSAGTILGTLGAFFGGKMIRRSEGKQGQL